MNEPTYWIWTDSRDGKRWLVQMSALKVESTGPSRWRMIFSDPSASIQHAADHVSDGGKPSDEEMMKLLDRAKRPLRLSW